MDKYSGLTSAEAFRKLKSEGYNELPTAKPKNVGKIILDVVREPMFILLLSCGSLYLILGDYNEGIILLFWVFVIIFITFYQERKTEKALEALRRIASPRALVIRDGIEIRIAGREVVLDDLILLNEGDRVPADAVLIDSMGLTVDESLLTGESMPVIKSVSADPMADLNKVFSGTLVVQGRGSARVNCTGFNTRLGRIGQSLAVIKRDETRLQKEMKTLIRRLFVGGVVISVGVILAFYFTRGLFLQSLLNGLAAAMALLPEEFPVVLTVFLSLGAWRISKINVLTRKPSAIETLGSATVLCSDKTGTITQNKMVIAALDTATQLYKKENIPLNKSDVFPLLHNLYLASVPNSNDPMEKAIMTEYYALYENKNTLNCIREYPLGNDLFAITRVVVDSESDQCIAWCKGAPEAVIKLCRLHSDEEEKILTKVRNLADAGYRVIAAASVQCNPDALPTDQQGFHFVFCGLAGFEDPIRPEVPDAIQQCSNAGIQVKMITGDYPLTALKIAEQIGLNTGGKVLTGADLSNMKHNELKEKIAETMVFARIVPEQKLQIISLLKEMGEVVAMTGDGVNDAPALKAADIGIAMGMKGSDVAREASSLVLLDDNFASIVAAIRSGRRIFDNLQKAMAYILAIHIPIIGLVLLPSFIPALPILLMPLHIVFLELIIDPVCAIAFESEGEEKDIMNRPSRDPSEKFFGSQKIFFSLLYGVLLFIMVIVVYFMSIGEGHKPGEVRAIAFSSLIVGNIFLILSSLSNTRSFLWAIRERNRAIFLIAGLAITVLILTISVPGLQSIFNFNFPGYHHFISAIVAAFVMLFVIEMIKMLRNRKSIIGVKKRV